MTAQCKYCEESFKWDDEVIQVESDFYHVSCVKLYPTGWVAYCGDEYLGETENDDGNMAYEYFDGLLDNTDENKSLLNWRA